MKAKAGWKYRVRLTIRRLRDDEKGSAFLVAVMLSVVGGILMVAGTRMLTQSNKESLFESRFLVEADNASRAGIAEALAWFRNQPAGVYAGTGAASGSAGYLNWQDDSFFPRQVVTPPVGQLTPVPETIDETMGLVREYQLSSTGMAGPPRWMRYEVHRQRWPVGVNPSQTPYPVPTWSPIPSPVVAGVISPTPTPMPWDVNAVHDISGERIPGGTDGQGNVWQITSIGIVFNRFDNTKAYNQAPNQILARSAIQTEFRRMNISQPGAGGNTNSNAAVYVGGKASSVTLKAQSSIRGDAGATADQAYGIIALTPTGAPVTSNGGIVRGGAGYSPVTFANASPAPSIAYSVFFTGMQLKDIKSVADYSVANISDLYSGGATQLSPQKLYVIDPPTGTAVTFADPYPFVGAMDSIIVVDGDLVINPASNEEFGSSGILYVTGNLTIRPSTTISGVVVVGGNLTLNPDGTNSDTAIYFDSSDLNTTIQQVAAYRENQGAVRKYSNWLFH